MLVLKTVLRTLLLHKEREVLFVRWHIAQLENSILRKSQRVYAMIENKRGLKNESSSMNYALHKTSD